MLRIHLYGLCVWLCLALPWSAMAQTMVIGGGLQIGDDQKLMFEAARQVMQHDYQGAQVTYSKAIAINGQNIDAYLQRGIVRRELGDAAGTAFDGNRAVLLANAALQGSTNNPNLYYQRGMGFRLLKNFNQAKQDIRTGMQLGGSQNWQLDLQAIELEQRAAR